jgi:hypothetical protein
MVWFAPLVDEDDSLEGFLDSEHVVLQFIMLSSTMHGAYFSDYRRLIGIQWSIL